MIVTSLDPSSPDDTGDIPTVYLDHRTRPGELSILIDNVDGARQAVEHLFAHGRRAIGHVAGPEGAPGADDRVAGWERTLRSTGATHGLELLRRADFSRAGGYEAGRQLLDAADRPDALFVSSDVQALGVLRAARELAITVPDDLAVISFDGTDDDLQRPGADRGRTAGGPDRRRGAQRRAAAGTPAHHPDPVRLVLRDSCGRHRLVRLACQSSS